MASPGWLIQILLPLYDNEGQRFGEAAFGETRAELLEAFGGLTAYQRAPAKGLWKTDGGEVARDDVVIVEVMAASLDRAWWEAYRGTLERRFRQDAIVIRANAHELL
jgi:hypothetical protein